MPPKNTTKQTSEERKAKQREYEETHREERRAKNRERYYAHLEERRAKHRAYEEANREERRAKNRAYCEANRDKRRAKDHVYDAANRDKRQAYEDANRDKRRASWRAHRENNRDARALYHRSYRAVNRDALSVYRRAYQRANSRKYISYNQNRRARKLGNGGSYTVAEWCALCDWFGNICLKCGTDGILSVDHVIPVALGGSNTIDNLQPLCKSCNSSKHTKTTDYRDPVMLAAFLEAQKGK